MPVNCDPSALAEAAKCYCFNERTAEQIKILLLANIAGLQGLTPAQLADQAKCYCYDEKTAFAVQNYLACQIANALGA